MLYRQFSRALKTAIFSISATLLPIALTYVLKRHYIKKRAILSTSKKTDNSYYHCIFCTLENGNCKEHIINSIECGEKCSYVYLQTFAKLISSAKFSIRMCNYMLTLRQITDEMIKAHERGVSVRLITDCVTAQMSSTKAKVLESYGIDVKTQPPGNTTSYMHHKFCVIDAEDLQLQKVFMGSLNLTLQGLVSNFECVVITNNAKMVQRYSEHFDLMWNDL